MSLSEFINQGWRDHAADAAGVASRLPEGMELISQMSDLTAFCGLLVHVLGEHLGQWQRGLDLLTAMKDQPAAADADGMRTLLRSAAILELAQGQEQKALDLAAEARDPGHPAESALVRVFATAASALAGQEQTERAGTLLDRAMAYAGYGPTASDPAARALAITGNNLAISLEEKSARQPVETALMIKAAQCGRQFWEIAGSWVEVERAEYRLALTHLNAGDATTGLHHAETGLAICRNQQSSLFEQFFFHEARTRCLRALNRTDDADAARKDAAGCLDQVKDSFSYMAEVLEKL